MNTDKRRVPVHKDEWVTECALLRMENANLRNRVAQLEWELEKARNPHGVKQVFRGLAGWFKNGIADESTARTIGGVR